MTTTVRQLSVNDVDLDYVDQGAGNTILFVHGYISDHRVWDAQQQTIPAGYRYIAPSQRYFGTRPWQDEGESFSFATHVDDLAAFVHRLDVAPVHVVGWSYGAALALALAVRHPDCVRSLFAYEPGSVTFVTDPDDIRILADDRADMVTPAVAAQERGDLRDALRQVFDHANGRTGLFDTLAPATRSAFLDNARTIPLLFRSPPPLPITDVELGQIRVPVAIARGELTRTFYRVVAQTAGRLIPDARLVVLCDGMHAAPVLTPERFNEAFLAFHRDIDARLTSPVRAPA
ncbi:alpha/beta fold hydrolase [Burkholderia sp. LMG 32019]|uniref:alpha/beta fold hydrolase n=1 Tax=Burkholderia sp. LMG 32019 TaxID=3158173 RepID=UPI003C2C5814